MLALDEALESLYKVDERKGRLVELHCFGGLTMDESAEVLRISPELRSAIGNWPRLG